MTEATVMVIGGESFGRIITVQLVDEGDSGLGIVCPAPIQPGAIVCLGFAQLGRAGRRGVVARCEPIDGGYHVGVRYEGRLAA